MRNRRIQIRGEKWRIVFGRPPRNKCAALCDWNTRTIWIRPRENPTRRKVVACIVHEILHGCFPDMSEQAIEETEESLMAGIAIALPELAEKKCAT